MDSIRQDTSGVTRLIHLSSLTGQHLFAASEWVEGRPLSRTATTERAVRQMISSRGCRLEASRGRGHRLPEIHIAA